MTDVIKPTPQQVLDLALPENDANAPTVRAYLGTLLMNVWVDGECFDGKRPFGNSGWQGDFDKALIEAGWVRGKLDEAVDELVRAAITALVAGSGATTAVDA